MILEKYAFPHPSDSKGITEMTKTFVRVVVTENGIGKLGKQVVCFIVLLQYVFMV